MSKDMHQYDRNMVIDKVDENGIKWVLIQPIKPF